jgi:hypothetical protein
MNGPSARWKKRSTIRGKRILDGIVSLHRLSAALRHAAMNSAGR